MPEASRNAADQEADINGEQEVCIIMDEKIVMLWSLALIGNRDWLAGVREIIPEEKYELTYRFRIYKDGEVFESKDEKHWYRATLSGTRNYVIQSLREWMKIMRLAAIGPLHEVENHGDLEEFGRQVEALPNMFMRQEGKI